MSDLDDVYAAIGYGGVTTGQVLHKLMEQYRKETKAQQAAEWLEQKEGQRPQQSCQQGRGVIVRGEPNMVVRFAHCCSPLPGDPIIGYITRGRGVSIHRADCPNMADLMVEPERMIEAEWTRSEKSTYTASIQVIAGERPGLLMEISQILLNLNISIKSMNAKTTGDIVNVQLSFDVSGADQLESIIKQVKRVKLVNEVYRINV